MRKHRTLPRSAALLCLLALAAVPKGAAAAKAPGQSDPPGKTITIANFKFEPPTITVKAGTTVTWENKEGSHTVMADNSSFESPTLTAGKTFSHKFAKPGTYRYYCSFHGSKGGVDGMVGTVKVVR